EGFDDALLHVLALRRCIASDKNRVRSHGPPKGLGFQCDDLKRLLEGDSVQFDFDPARSVIRIEKHVNSGQLADCFVNNFRIFSELECDWDIRDHRQLDGALRFLNPLLKATRRGGGGLWTRGFGSVDHLLRPPYFLLSNGAGRIDLNRFLELSQGFVELARIAQQLAALHVGSSGVKTQPLVSGAVGKIFGFQIVSLFVVLVGLLVILPGMCVSPVFYSDSSWCSRRSGEGVP